MKISANRVTLFCSNALARYFAPSLPMLLYLRLSVISVCKNSDWNNNRKSDANRVTSFFCKALASCRAPCESILLL
jgi:hypothetical protein